MRNFIIVLGILFIAVLGYTGADRIIQTQKLEVSEPAASGTNKITLTSPALSGDYTFTLPNTSGTSGYILATDGSGGLSWTNSLTSPIFSGTITTPLTASRALVTGASSQLSASSVTSTELGYLSGVTSPTGSGALVLAISPTLVTPNLGTPSAATLTNATGLPLTTGVPGPLPIGNGGTGQTTANNALNAFLPSQGGNSGKVLGTDGTNTAWIANGATVAMGSGLTGSTVGSVLFVGAGSVLAQDNSNFYYDSTNKRLGIGAIPSYVFHSYNATSNINYVSGDATTSSYLARASTDASSPDYVFRKARNTTASPNAVSSGDVNGRFLFQAHGGANWRSISAIQSAVDSYTSDTQIGGRLQFFTSPSSAASATERMRITQAGDVGINNTSPGAKLDVSSEIRVTSSGGATGQLLSDSTDFYVGPTGAHNLRLQSNGSTRVVVDSNGNVTFTAIHNNGSPPTNTTQTVSSGTYTPTITNSTNVAASSNPTAIWSRVGNVVTVSGSVEIDPTSATTNTLAGISLPIASNFTAGTDAFGMATMAPSVADPADGWLTADATNDRMTLQMYPNVTTNQEWRFHFQYVVK